MRTHYENLKVAEDAPEEVIRAAYKALSLRHHPDQNGGSTEAQRVMQIINAAYEVLGNPTKRANYDAFLWRTRIASDSGRAASGSTQSINRVPSEATSVPVSKQQPQSKRGVFGILFGLLIWDLRITLALLFFGWLAVMEFSKEQKRMKASPLVRPTTSSRETRPKAPNPTQVDWSQVVNTPRTEGATQSAIPSYVRPAYAPNGYPWPSFASYLPATNVWASGGLSSVTVDNTRCDSDVHVKLNIWRNMQSFVARECFIPARSAFTFEKVAPGWFDVRYRDLDTGQLAKTETFQLLETQTPSGTNYSKLSLTLYKVAHGNMETTGIPESEF